MCQGDSNSPEEVIVSIPSKFSHRSIPIFIGIAALLLLSACSTVSGGVKVPANLPSGPSALTSGQSVGRIAISLNSEKLTPSVIEVAERYEIVRILGNRVREKLQVSGGELEVEVDVIGLRLRSSGTAFWWAMMAGGDWITVDVNVNQDGHSIKNFQTGTGTVLGGIAFGALGTRVGRMMKTLAIRIAEGV